MAVSKKQLSITISRKDKNMIRALAKRDQVSIGAKVNELLRMSIELEEDKVLSAIAEERDNEKNIKWVSGNEVWNS